MKWKDLQWIINRRIVDKRNIFLFLIMTIIFIILFLCINMLYFYYDYQETSINNNSSFRTLIISGSDKLKEAKQIEHVQIIESTKYYNGMYIFAKEFDNELKGGFGLKSVFEGDNLPIIEGRNIENSREMICPNQFYPYDSYLLDKKINKIYPSLYLKGEDIIGTTISIESSNEDNLNKEYQFTIVGTYDAIQTQDSVDTCYTTKEDLELIKSKYKGLIIVTEPDGTTYNDYVLYDDYMVRVYDYKNIPEVQEQLKNLGFNVGRAVTSDDESIKLYLSIPIFLSIILIIISINIIYSFLNKKLKYRFKNYTLLRNCGYDYKTIKKLDNLENIEIILVSFILSLILYYIGFQIVMNTILTPILYDNIIVKIPYFYFSITVLLTMLLSIFINNKILKKKIYKLSGDY